MLDYDPQVFGNNYFLTMRDGKIVAMMDWHGLTPEQRSLIPETQMQHVFVLWYGQEVGVLCVTIEDAMEAIRRYDSGLASGIQCGEFQLFRKTKEFIEV